jgi:hypothetical protein
MWTSSYSFIVITATRVSRSSVSATGCSEFLKAMGVLHAFYQFHQYSLEPVRNKNGVKKLIAIATDQ